MAFQKGESGNSSGRPKGSKNKVNEKIRKKLSVFLFDNFDQIELDFENMKPYARTRLFVDLLPFVLPKLQSSTNKINYEDLTNEQLDTIIEELKKSQL